MTTDKAKPHPREWWAQFPQASARFDVPYVVEELGDLIEGRVKAPLLRQEVKIAMDVVTRHLHRRTSTELVARAEAARKRLATTLERIDQRSGGGISTVEAAAVLLALQGDCPGAAAAAEPFLGFRPLLRLFVTALRLERFDIPFTLRLIERGQEPAEAIRSGYLLGQYGWWPAWLQRVVTERALAGTLDEATIEALDQCAYAALSPAQATLARKLLSGDPVLISTAAQRLAQLARRTQVAGCARAT